MSTQELSTCKGWQTLGWSSILFCIYLPIYTHIHVHIYRQTGISPPREEDDVGQVLKCYTGIINQPNTTLKWPGSQERYSGVCCEVSLAE